MLNAVVVNKAWLLSHYSHLYLTRKYGTSFLECIPDLSKLMYLTSVCFFQLDLFLFQYQTPGAGQLTHLPPTPPGLLKLLALAHTMVSLPNAIPAGICLYRALNLQGSTPVPPLPLNHSWPPPSNSWWPFNMRKSKNLNFQTLFPRYLHPAFKLFLYELLRE